MSSKCVAVIGGGVFGCTTAIEIAHAGFSVTLFERAEDIMTAASAINQYRMHRGYHYPRSNETILSCLEATPLFEEEYKEAIIAHHDHYYAIAKEGSKLTGAEYLAVLEKHHLPYVIEKPEHLNHDMLDVVIRADENLYDPFVLKSIFHERLRENGVEIRCNEHVYVDDLSDYDAVVVATYASLNNTLRTREEHHCEYQFEVCEKIVIDIPKLHMGISTVVMDGPFMSFDPLGETGLAVMGHVEHAIHHRSVGFEPEIPVYIAPFLNKGIIKEPTHTRASFFLEDSIRFMPALKDAVHVGSMFTIRTVLPRVDATDERPTLVRKLDDRVFTIYSGKVGNSIKAARTVLEFLRVN